MKEEEGSTSASSCLSRSLSSETRAVEEDFIETYKNLPLLWDTDHKHNSNKYKRNEALDVLLKIIKRWNPSATRMDVRQKINILRSTYRKQRRKCLASRTIGPNGEEIYEYEPTNWKFHALKFLDKERDSNDMAEISEINIDNNIEDEDSNESESETGESLSHTSDALAAITEDEPPRKRLKAKKSNKFLKVEIEDDYYDTNDNLLDRELEAIGANVTCKLKRMNSLQRYHAELLINKVLISGLKNSLTDETDLTDVYRT
ncbi:hypothetical protein PYW07_009491 [Mythimna separata]|uniref:MADF domain-containing protein n=1 Tax=Mythimna separata TaxID=271217 RepID=A0AAD7YCE3_MYTSE|nr:hypothetical protein PYW07_009491 [Mythimna separata]